MGIQKELFMQNTKIKAFTHGGRFHADEVFSTALLQLVYNEVEVTRGYNVPDDFDGIVYDIGGGEFDHHEKNPQKRGNGTPYAAFGLLWRKFGPDIAGVTESAYIDEHFISPLDLDDNTGSGSSLASAISSFNPFWDSEESSDELFFKAVSFAKEILANKINGLKANARAVELVATAVSNMKDDIVVLPTYAPWKRGVKDTNALFIAYPSQRGGYAAQGVSDPRSLVDALKCPFPESWGGLSDEQLENVSGIEGMKFCHNNCFMITGTSLAVVLEACKKAKEIEFY